MYSAEPKLKRSQLRLDRVAKALAMRQEKRPHSEIAAALGVSVSTVASYLTDPDGSQARARKQRYRGVCSACGNATNRGQRLHPGETFICSRCDDDSRRKWTTDRVIEALRAWHAETGEWPTSSDLRTDAKTRRRRLESSRAKTRERALRREALLSAREYPEPTAVRRLFGTMAAAVDEASGAAPRQTP